MDIYDLIGNADKYWLITIDGKMKPSGDCPHVKARARGFAEPEWNCGRDRRRVLSLLCTEENCKIKLILRRKG